MSWKQDIINDIDIVNQETEQGFNYKIFKNAPKSVQLNTEHIGKRVWYADLPRTKKIKLLSIDEDVYRITRQGEKTFMSVYPNEVLLHPSEWNKNDQK